MPGGTERPPAFRHRSRQPRGASPPYRPRQLDPQDGGGHGAGPEGAGGSGRWLCRRRRLRPLHGADSVADRPGGPGSRLQPAVRRGGGGARGGRGAAEPFAAPAPLLRGQAERAPCRGLKQRLDRPWGPARSRVREQPAGPGPGPTAHGGPAGGAGSWARSCAVGFA